MRAIRTLLWIGCGQGLADCGINEAPTLDVTWVRDVEDSYALPRISFDACVIEGDRVEVLARAIGHFRRRPQCPPVVACFAGDDAACIRALLAAGASEVLLAPGVVEGGPRLLDELLARVERLARKKRAAGDAAAAADADGPPTPVTGRSRAIRDVYALAERAAKARATVLVHGETGTGKEVIARHIHRCSARSRGPYVAVNCAAFPETLLESELFGHRKGAFTGADKHKAGHFELAHRGTLFLDEIAETSPGLQAKLLRVLQEREVLPLGATQPHPIDVRVIAASNRSLAREVEARRFREDLFYRLDVFPISIPPLRERPEDIVALAEHFLDVYGEQEGKPGCALSSASLRLMQSHTWPGNVRELENEVQRALTLAEPGELITPKLLSKNLLGIVEAVDGARVGGDNLRDALDRVEAWLIRRALELNGGRRALTARKLGVTREGLYKKMKRLGIG